MGNGEFRREVSNIFEVLGIDEEELEWQDLSMCQGMDTKLFYDDYESNPDIAVQVDQACLSCPVLMECGLAGRENSEYGVWGGFFLTAGSVDEARNKHKTPEVRKALAKRYGAIR